MVEFTTFFKHRGISHFDDLDQRVPLILNEMFLKQMTLYSSSNKQWEGKLHRNKF